MTNKTSKSTTDAAFEILSSKKRAMNFAKLWQDVAKATGTNPDMISQFYSDLTLDGRFTSLKDNKWDLRSRRKFSESFVDISKFELEDENEDVGYLPEGEEEKNSSDDEQ